MEQLNQEPVTDMTAAEYFNGEGSPLTLDKILQPQERDFLLEHIELYAQGKVNQFKASQSHPAPEPNEVGEVYVWVKASEQNPSPEKKEHFICLIEKRGNGKVEVKPAYGYWCYSTWRVEDGWKVIEWLSIHQSHPAPVGQQGEVFSIDGKTTVIEIDEMLREFYTKNKDDKGSGFGRRVIQQIVKQVSDSQRHLFKPKALPPLPPPPHTSGEDAVRGWISVEDGELPEHEDVLVKLGADTILMGICNSNKEWCIYWADGRKSQDPDRPVTHWMPLPPLPTTPTT